MVYPSVRMGILTRMTLNTNSRPDPAATGPSPAVRARDLALGYGSSVVVRDIDLDIPWGASVAVIGPNGSGKSTFLRALAGLIDPMGGTLEVGPGAVAPVSTAMVLQATEVDRSLPVSVDVLTQERVGPAFIDYLAETFPDVVEV